MENINLAVIFLTSAIVAILLSLPLIFRKIKRNGIYGIRIPESFRSEERWFEINRLGGILFLLWGMVMGITGVVGLTLESRHWSRYNLIATGICIGGLGLVVAAIFLYAAMTKRP